MKHPKHTAKNLWAALLAAVMLFGLSVNSAAAVTGSSLSAAVTDTAQYLYRTVKEPQVGSTGGEWAVLGLARSGYEVPEAYYQDYYARVEDYVAACSGVLHEKKYTEYSRVIVGLAAIGADARDVAGYDLTKPLGDYDKTIWQGMNGPIWALIALDSRDYPMPQNPEAKTQATRQMYIDRILECQLLDGGWSLTGGAASSAGNGVSDPDITGMALQALAKYQDQPAVAQAIGEALACMSKQQDSEGGFSSWGTANVESCVQMIVALCELDIPLNDPGFVKNGHTMLDNLMTFYQPGKGFLHTKDGSGDSLMSTEQGLYALAAVLRMEQGESSLYRMDGVASVGGETTQPGTGLADKHPDVSAVPVSQPDVTFEDVAGHENQAAVEALASRGIITGSKGLFDPDGTMTRAQFAAIVVRALGLEPKASGSFSDVPANEWYAGFVGTASQYGIITGIGGGQFAPDGTITRGQAAVMVARAAKLCGMDTDLDTAAVRDVLAQFGDYVQTPEWARQGLAFCCDSGILDDSALNIEADEAVRRCEVAQMLFNLLDRAKLL